MDHQGVHKNLFQKCLFNPELNWNLEMLVFEEGKTRVSREKPLRTEKRTNNKLNPHKMPGPGIEHRTHWWEASALTTVPFPLPCIKINCYIFDRYFSLQPNIES